MFICPNCTNRLERNNILEKIIYCPIWNNDWVGIPKRKKYDLLEMINWGLAKAIEGYFD